MSPFSRFRRRGVSLLEVALALAVLTFGIGGVVQLFINSQRSSGLVRNRLAAESLALAKSQEFKAAGYEAAFEHLGRNSPPGAPRVASYPDAPAASELPGTAVRGEAVPCVWQARIEALPDAPECLRVVSSVEWTDASGERRVESRVYLVR